MKKITLNLKKTTKMFVAQIVLLSLCGQMHAKSSEAEVLVETNRVWINVTSPQGAFSQTLMGYRAGATDGYDHALDGAFMNDGDISLASLIGTSRYAIQFKGLPFSNTDIVPLSFSATSNGIYTFAIDHMDGFFIIPSFAVYIHDKSNNTYNNLKTGGYTFTSNSGMYNDRFELTYIANGVSLGTDLNTFTASNVNISQNSGSIVIDSGMTVLKSITIYSFLGSVLYQGLNLNSSQITVDSSIQHRQPLIVKITTQEGIVVSKKWLYL